MSYIWNPATCSCKNGKYLASVISKSVISCDESIDAIETKTVATNLNEKKRSLKKIYFISYLLL